MDQRLTKLEEELSGAKQDVIDIKTRLAVAEANIKDIKEDLSSIKNNTTWIIRLILGIIIAAILGLVIKGGV